jgi:hypothetical protein
MTKDRKAAIAAWKERKSRPGIYALRCLPSGQCWVGSAPDLATVETRLRFGLRMGTHPRPSLQAAVRSHGEAAFAFEIRQELPEEEIPAILAKQLRDRATYWQAQLNALAV